MERKSLKDIIDLSQRDFWQTFGILPARAIITQEAREALVRSSILIARQITFVSEGPTRDAPQVGELKGYNNRPPIQTDLYIKLSKKEQENITREYRARHKEPLPKNFLLLSARQSFWQFHFWRAFFPQTKLYSLDAYF